MNEIMTILRNVFLLYIIKLILLIYSKEQDIILMSQSLLTIF
jgi:hypothetical protein